MPHNPLPKNAPRISPSEVGQLLDIPSGLSKTYATIKGSITKRPQTEHGMGKDGDVHEITAECPKCEDLITVHSDLPAGKHPVICHCDMSVVFAIEWDMNGSTPAAQPTPPAPKNGKSGRK